MTSAEARLIQSGARDLGVILGGEALQRLGCFLTLLGVWNRRVRLTGERDPETVIRQHALDSLAAVPSIPEAGLVVDIGSGAGFPGIVLGCVRDDLELALIESRRRRASFLREAARTIPLPSVRVLEVRAEAAASERELAGRAAAAIARGLRLDAFLGLAVPLLAPGGVAIAMQTPRTAALAGKTGHDHGLSLTARHDYTLPGGGARSLLLFRRGEIAVS
jgi:16S rRNA (guanine527-N7)-methyltransferase